MFILHTGGIVRNAALISNLICVHAFDAMRRHHQLSCKTLCLPLRITKCRNFSSAEITLQSETAKAQGKIMAYLMSDSHSVSAFTIARALIDALFDADMPCADICVCMNFFR